MEKNIESFLQQERRGLLSKNMGARFEGNL